VKGKLIAGVVVAAGLVFASDPLMEFLQKWESSGKRVLVVYADKLAGGLPTVCNGLTKHVTDTPIVVGDVWSDKKCVAEERRAMIKHVQKPLEKCMPADVPQSVFDALSSHGWNFGVGKTCGSVAAQYVRAGDFETGCKRIARDLKGKPVWSSSAGRFARGLFLRRLDEVKFCLRDIQ
jgi:lysozyme